MIHCLVYCSPTRSNVADHLSCLRGCGLVLAAYEGRQVRCTPADPHVATALRELLLVVFAVQPTEECVDRAPEPA